MPDAIGHAHEARASIHGPPDGSAGVFLSRRSSGRMRWIRRLSRFSASRAGSTSPVETDLFDLAVCHLVYRLEKALELFEGGFVEVFQKSFPTCGHPLIEGI